MADLLRFLEIPLNRRPIHYVIAGGDPDHRPSRPSTYGYGEQVVAKGL